jgi:hypothetical protein
MSSAFEDVKELLGVWSDRSMTVNATARSRPLSSWSANPDTALEFTADASGMYGPASRQSSIALVMREDVAASRVFSTPLTGPGSREENEFIALGGRSSVSVMDAHSLSDVYDDDDIDWDKPWALERGLQDAFDAAPSANPDCASQFASGSCPLVHVDFDEMNSDWVKNTEQSRDKARQNPEVDQPDADALVALGDSMLAAAQTAKPGSDARRAIEKAIWAGEIPGVKTVSRPEDYESANGISILEKDDGTKIVMKHEAGTSNARAEESSAEFIRGVDLPAPRVALVGDGEQRIVLMQYAGDIEGLGPGELAPRVPDPKKLDEDGLLEGFRVYLADNVIMNSDRHGGNMMTFTTEDGRVRSVVIDNGFSLEETSLNNRGSGRYRTPSEYLEDEDGNVNRAAAQLWLQSRSREEAIAEIEAFSKKMLERANKMKTRDEKQKQFIQRNAKWMTDNAPGWYDAFRDAYLRDPEDTDWIFDYSLMEI